MVHRKLLPLFIFTVFLLLSSCTGSTSQVGKPQVDGNGIQGNTEVAYYSVINLNQANVVLTKGEGHDGRLLALNSRVITSQTSIPAEDLSFSVDQSILVVKGRNELFELSSTSVDSILNSQSPLTLAKVDSYCKGLTGSYPELLIEATTTYQLFGLSSSSKDIIGGTAVVEKSEQAITVEYSKAGFGILAVNKSQPHPTDPYFFRASFTGGAPAPWNTQTDMYCHLNTNPVPVFQGNVLVSDIALNSNATFSGGFATHAKAKIPDNNFADWDGQDVESDFISLTGYFSRPGVELPATATIDGVKANCFWWGSSEPVNATFSLLKDGIIIGAPRTAIATFGNPPNVPILGQDFGGATDLWRTTLSPADILSSTFGIQMDFKVSGLFSAPWGISIDYCRLSVYWH